MVIANFYEFAVAGRLHQYKVVVTPRLEREKFRKLRDKLLLQGGLSEISQSSEPKAS